MHQRLMVTHETSTKAQNTERGTDSQTGLREEVYRKCTVTVWGQAGRLMDERGKEVGKGIAAAACLL